MRNFIVSEDEVDTSKPRKTVHDTIFSKHYDGEQRHIPVKDLPEDLQQTDIIEYISDPGYYSENNSWDPFTQIKILRPRLENDEEYEKRHKLSRDFLHKNKEPCHKL